MLDKHIQDYADQIISWDHLMQISAQTTQQHDKAQGAIYTPAWIVSDLITHSNITPADIIWEPSCGHGAFVIPILEHVCAGYPLAQTLDWLNTHLYASDIDPEAIQTLRLVLQAWFVRTYNHKPPLDAFHSLFVQDGLTWQPPQKPTLIIGNPPYVRFQNLSDDVRGFLSTRYESCTKGNVDLYYAFLERSAELADRTAYIVPNAFLSTQSGHVLRTLLREYSPD